MKRKRFLPMFAFLLIASLSGQARAQFSDAEIVRCLNTTNGYPTRLDTTPWHHTQAQVIVQHFRERLWLRAHHTLIFGRPLGWHSTWIAFVDTSQPTPVAYETLRQNGMRVFGARFVPKAARFAFESCGIAWGGHWDGKFPYIQNQVSPPPPERKLGKNLLPPPIVWEN